MFPSCLNSMTKWVVVTSIVCAAVLAFCLAPAAAQQRFQRIAPQPPRVTPKPPRVIGKSPWSRYTTKPVPLGQQPPSLTPHGPVPGFDLGVVPKIPKTLMVARCGLPKKRLLSLAG